MRRRTTNLVATFFYIGNLPFAAGTIASAAGALIYFLLRNNSFLYVFCFGIITALGFVSSGKMEKMLKQKDPDCVVIDEVSGIMLSLFLLPPDLSVILTGFFLFRAFDMFKIYPANKYEEKGGSAGIMMDDIIAGIYTNITMHIAIKLAGI